MKPSRRTFLITSIGVASTFALSRQAFADAPKVAETDPTAQALGYKEDATQSRQGEVRQVRTGPGLRQLQLLPGQADRRLRRLPDVRRQAGGEQGLVQRI